MKHREAQARLVELVFGDAVGGDEEARHLAERGDVAARGVARPPP